MMKSLSQDAHSLLCQIKGRLQERKSREFFFMEGIQTIAFGLLVGPDNILPPMTHMQGEELERHRQGTASALKELADHGIVKYCGQCEEYTTYQLVEGY